MHESLSFLGSVIQLKESPDHQYFSFVPKHRDGRIVGGRLYLLTPINPRYFLRWRHDTPGLNRSFMHCELIVQGGDFFQEPSEWRGYWLAMIEDAYLHEDIQRLRYLRCPLHSAERIMYRPLEQAVSILLQWQEPNPTNLDEIDPAWLAAIATKENPAQPR